MNTEEKGVWTRILDGTLDIDHAEVLSMENRSPQFAKATQELRQVQASLSDAGGEMRSILEEARTSTPTEADLRLMDLIPEGPSPGGQDQQPTPLPTNPARGAQPLAWPRWLGLAAAVLVAVLGMNWYLSNGAGSKTGSKTGSEASNGPVLGSADSLRLLAPLQEASTFDRFHWEGPSALGAWYVVHVVNLDTQEVVTSPKLTKPEWTPKPTLTATHFDWYVVWHDPSKGEPVSSSKVTITP